MKNYKGPPYLANDEVTWQDDSAGQVAGRDTTSRLHLAYSTATPSI